MSTSYYHLSTPVTSVRPEIMGGHTHMGIWVNHAKAGTLILRNEEWIGFLRLLTNEEFDDSKAPMRTHWGGAEVGSIVTENENDLMDETQLVSEYGELLTVAEIRAFSGEKRADGLPTELFGHEGKKE
jgi:hypothetical protein